MPAGFAGVKFVWKGRNWTAYRIQNQKEGGEEKGEAESEMEGEEVGMMSQNDSGEK